MSSDVLYEVCVEDLRGVEAAARGGAQRVELCATLAIGGVTPSAGAMRAARSAAQVAPTLDAVRVVAMVRPRGGDFVYSDAELAAMRADVRAAQDAELDGVVLGVLRSNGEIDVERMRELIELAHPLDVALHRAFDQTPNLLDSLDIAIELGVTRVLTGGHPGDAEDGLEMLANLVERTKRANTSTRILVGGGVRASNVRRIVDATGACEVHGRAPIAGAAQHFAATDEEAVRAVVRALRG